MNRPNPIRAQDRLSVEKNKGFFADNAGYAENVAELKTYRNIRRAVDERIAGVTRLLDVGNGGVFDYDTARIPEIVGVDLFLDEASPGHVPPNVVLRRGDALALHEPDATFDGVLFVAVLHHLVSTDVNGTVANIDVALREARRVLQPGGRLVVIESCISEFFFAIERRLFPSLRAIAATPLMRHPPTLQLPPREIEKLIRAHFDEVQVDRLPVGPFILQFGHRWPTMLTPARPFAFIAR